MKANAPDKLYFFESEPILLARSKKLEGTDIEYTRTDCLVEKARKWFIEHVNVSQEVDINEDGEPLADSYIKYAQERLNAANEIFENFIKYMKGE